MAHKRRATSMHLPAADADRRWAISDDGTVTVTVTVTVIVPVSVSVTVIVSVCV